MGIMLVVLGTPRRTVKASPGAEPAPILYTATPHYDGLAWMRGDDRFPSGATIFIRDAQGRRVLVPGFAATADPSVSFDGQRVLFAAKRKPQDSWQVWEMSIAGGDPHRITSGAEDCVRPFYLPDDRVVYARRIAGKFTIETVSLSGGKPLALTYGPTNFVTTDVLRDGRILFETAYPLGADGTPETYTVYSDGSGVESYRCDHGAPRHSGRQISSGDIILASSKGLSRFTSAHAHELAVQAPKGDYAGDIAETPAGEWLVSWRADTNAAFQLMRWTPGSSTLQPFLEDAADSIVQPVVLAARPVPNRHPSGLHDWNNANLLCLNSYTSKYPFAAASIQSVKLYTRDRAGNPELLGTAPVERDGSFFVQVPTEQPLQIELLDAAGKTLKRESGFFWMRRGEQRACVGCHAGPETAPENAVPLILLKSTTPADMTNSATPTASGGH